MAMLKDNVFSISRFMNLCRKNMVESWRKNLLRVALMYGVMTVIFVWAGYLKYDKLAPDSLDPMIEISIYVFLWFGMICGCISASFTMENMKSKTSRLSALMTPATPFEKYFSRWLVSTIVYVLVFIIAFKLADYTRVIIYSLAYPEHTIAVTKLKYLFVTSGDYSFFAHVPIQTKKLCFVFYFFFQSCFILGSSIWPKNSLVKTFVTGFVIMLLHGFAIGVVGQFLFDEADFTNKMTPENFENNVRDLIFIAGTFFILLNCTLAYFRFRESEIINRW